MICSAQTIRKRQPILPFFERSVLNGKTFGLSAAGYDIRAAEGITIPADGIIRLGSSFEHFIMPNDLLGVVHDKSSWARKGLAVQNTVIEPGWKGFLTLEYTNHGRHTLNIERGDPIAQIIFHILDEPTEQPYEGKYQNQKAGPQKAIHEHANPETLSDRGPY